MQKRVIFIGGSEDGLNNLCKYVREDESGGSSHYYEFVDSIKPDALLCVELEHIGAKVKTLLSHSKVHTLIIKNASEDARKVFMSEACDDRLEKLEVYRIWFNKYLDEVPDEYDTVIDPNSEHFVKILDKYFELG